MVGLKVADADGLDFSLVIQLLKGFPGFAVCFQYSFPARFWEWANESDKGPDSPGLSLSKDSWKDFFAFS